jgi:hypothetical protein
LIYLQKNTEAMKKMYNEHIHSPARMVAGKGDVKDLEEKLTKKKGKIEELKGLLSASEDKAHCLG